MKLHLLSDLHLEFHDFEIPPTDADIVVLAGDIGLGDKGVRFALTQITDKPVIYVAGNHEYYGEALPKLVGTLRKLTTGTNVHFLEDEDVVIGGVWFLGCTLWTDFALYGPETVEQAMEEAGDAMSDYQAIRKSPEYRRLSPRDTRRLHRTSMAWLSSKLAEPFSGPIVVVTHHAPSPRSGNPVFADDPLTPAFISNLEHFILERRPALWLHGHTHFGVDYRISDTRIVCNPRGYPGEAINRFVHTFVVEV